MNIVHVTGRIFFCSFYIVRELLDLIKRCAQFGESNSVLLIGPRGSGKSLVCLHIDVIILSKI